MIYNISAMVVYDDIDAYDYCYGCGRKMSMAKKYSDLVKAVNK